MKMIFHLYQLTCPIIEWTFNIKINSFFEWDISEMRLLVNITFENIFDTRTFAIEIVIMAKVSFSDWNITQNNLAQPLPP